MELVHQVAPSSRLIIGMFMQIVILMQSSFWRRQVFAPNNMPDPRIEPGTTACQADVLNTTLQHFLLVTPTKAMTEYNDRLISGVILVVESCTGSHWMKKVNNDYDIVFSQPERKRNDRLCTC